MKHLTFILMAVFSGLLSGFFPACGKKTSPIPPSLIIPQPMGEPVFISRPEAIFLVWPVPDKNVDGSPLKDLKGFQVYRHSEASAAGSIDIGSLKFEKLITIDYEFPNPARAEGKKVTFADKNVSPGQQYFYFLRAFNRRGYQGPPSNIIRVNRAQPLSPPRGLAVSPGDRWVQLSWQPPENPAPGGPETVLAGYNFYRSGEKEDIPFLPANPDPITRTVYTDLGLENNRTYYYRVSALERVNGSLNESPLSSAVSVLPEDHTPPLPPQGLTAVPAQSGVELRWEPNAEKDLAGYRVYRGKEPGFRMENLTPAPIPEPAYLDRNAVRGKSYRYQLTAVDSAPAPNESEASEPVNLRVPK
ncbi:MAG: hypothetical protein PHE84_07475 [bacterium]|nr:hypothetical protein [bacterium]